MQLYKMYGDKIQSTDIEVVLDNQTGRYALPNSDILRQKEIVAVFTRMRGGNIVRTPINENVLADDDTVRNAYLTLVSDSKRFLENHPLEDLATAASDRSHRYISIRGFTPTKSVVEVADPATNVTVGESILLHFVYLD